MGAGRTSVLMLSHSNTMQIWKWDQEGGVFRFLWRKCNWSVVGVRHYYLRQRRTTCVSNSNFFRKSLFRYEKNGKSIGTISSDSVKHVSPFTLVPVSKQNLLSLCLADDNLVKSFDILPLKQGRGWKGRHKWEGKSAHNKSIKEKKKNPSSAPTSLPPLHLFMLGHFISHRNRGLYWTPPYDWKVGSIRSAVLEVQKRNITSVTSQRRVRYKQVCHSYRVLLQRLHPRAHETGPCGISNVWICTFRSEEVEKDEEIERKRHLYSCPDVWSRRFFVSHSVKRQGYWLVDWLGWFVKGEHGSILFCSRSCVVLGCRLVLWCLVLSCLLLSCVVLCGILSRLVLSSCLVLSIYNSCRTLCDIRINARMGMRLHATKKKDIKRGHIYMSKGGRLVGRTRPRRKRRECNQTFVFPTNESNTTEDGRPNREAKEREKHSRLMVVRI